MPTNLFQEQEFMDGRVQEFSNPNPVGLTFRYPNSTDFPKRSSIAFSACEFKILLNNKI
jgi:hypothetical protein